MAKRQNIEQDKLDVSNSTIREIIKNKAEKILSETIYSERVLRESDMLNSGQKAEINKLIDDKISKYDSLTKKQKDEIKKMLENAFTGFLKNLWMRSDTFIKSM